MEEAENAVHEGRVEESNAYHEKQDKIKKSKKKSKKKGTYFLKKGMVLLRTKSESGNSYTEFVGLESAVGHLVK